MGKAEQGAKAALTLGARPMGKGRTHFRVWAPRRKQVELCLHEPSGQRFLPLEPTPGGYYEGTHPVPVGALYSYRLDGDSVLPDPCSRSQPQGPHGPSQVVDPSRYEWKDSHWPGLTLPGQVLYELHVGAYTPEGTYAALAARLPLLKELGITCVELMPLHTFPGRFNWGYDGVTLYAPCAVYGSPDELRRLVDEAHRLGLGMILDVVYNHLGPDGNYLAQYSQGYFTRKYANEWGEALNFDEGEAAASVREFFIQNACHWLTEYHFDGLRLDATHSLHDASPRHFMQELVERAREAAHPRPVLLIAENEPQHSQQVLPPEQGGYGADAVWVDDFHHTAQVALTGRAEAYLMDYQGTAQELLSCALRNSLYQGQYYQWQRKCRGDTLRHLEPRRAVFYLQNHDQIANRLNGARLHQLTSPARARALTTFFLLLPQTPLLFMGQEFFASAPFLYFVDHNPELQELVRKGRQEFLSQFPSARQALRAEGAPMPLGEESFAACKLDWSERERHAPVLALHKELLRLRREDPILSAQEGQRVEGAVLGPQALVLRYSASGQQGERLVLLNLGISLDLQPCPEPLLAPPVGNSWRVLLSSEHVCFGGQGTPPLPGEGQLSAPGQTALVLSSEEKEEK